MEMSAVFPVQPILARQTICMPRSFCSFAQVPAGFQQRPRRGQQHMAEGGNDP
jgi:hypothetical protein